MVSIVIEGKEAAGKKYLLRNRRMYFQKSIGHASPWDGLWVPPDKFFSSYTVSVNSKTLDSSRLEEVSVEPWGASLSYWAGKTRVEETCFVPDDENALVCILYLMDEAGAKKACVEISADVDLRTAADERGMDYKAVESGPRDAVIVKSRDKDQLFMFGLGRSETAREASWDGSTLKIDAKLDNGEAALPIIFIAGRGKGVVNRYDRLSRTYGRLLHDKKEAASLITGEALPFASYLATPDTRINDAFSWALAGMAGAGYHTNFPSIHHVNVRYLLWAALGMVDAGMFDAVKDVLSYVSSHHPTRLPSHIELSGEKRFEAADVDPLFLVVLDRYLKASGDRAFGRKMSKKAAAILKDAKKKERFTKHAPRETWMHTIEREGAIEIASLWAEAVKQRYPGMARSLVKFLKIKFWRHKDYYFDDSLADPVSTRVNPLVPVFFDQLTPFKTEDVLRKVKQEFITAHGIRTTSCLDPGYSSAHEHKGGVSMLATGWAAAAFLRHGRTESGLRVLGILADDLRKHHLGFFKHSANASTGELLKEAVSLEAGALFVHALDHGVFGIEPDVQDKKILFKPQIIEGWPSYERRGKKIGSRVMTMLVENKTSDKGLLDLVIEFDRAPGLMAELVLPEQIGRMEVAGRSVRGNKYSFRLKKRNRVWAFRKEEPS